MLKHWIFTAVKLTFLDGICDCSLNLLKHILEARGGSVVERRTPEREVEGSTPISAFSCCVLEQILFRYTEK